MKLKISASETVGKQDAFGAKLKISAQVDSEVETLFLDVLCETHFQLQIPVRPL